MVSTAPAQEGSGTAPRSCVTAPAPCTEEDISSPLTTRGSPLKETVHTSSLRYGGVVEKILTVKKYILSWLGVEVVRTQMQNST